jgi:Domain of unknown function (DUF5666)
MLGALEGAAQEPAAPASKPTEHIIGTVTGVDPATHTITVKEDKTGTEYAVLVGNTRTLLRVLPGAKDLKTATRITADDLQTGDRVDVRGLKPEDAAAAPANAIVARSVVLMSARDLAQAHQQQAAEWQHSVAGTVNTVDPSTPKLDVTVRTPGGPLPMTVNVSNSTEFTRYSAENPKVPAPSRLSDIQPGDQVRIIGQRSEDGSSIAAQKIYSGAFRAVAGTVSAIDPDGKQLTIKDLQTKQLVQVSLTADSVVRKLPPMMAMALARRLNPDFKAAQAGGSGGAGAENRGNAGGAPPYGAKAGEAAAAGSANAPGVTGGGEGGPGSGSMGSGSTGSGGPMRAGSGDLSRLLERAPAISLSDLKNGDAVVVSGAAQGTDKSHLLASTIIAGVEPIFQAAPAQQNRSLGDWSLDMQVPAQQ